MRRASSFESNPAGPFFLFLALTIPHANNEATYSKQNGQEVPDFGIYKDQPWSDAGQRSGRHDQSHGR